MNGFLGPFPSTRARWGWAWRPILAGQAGCHVTRRDPRRCAAPSPVRTERFAGGVMQLWISGLCSIHQA